MLGKCKRWGGGGDIRKQLKEIKRLQILKMRWKSHSRVRKRRDEERKMGILSKGRCVRDRRP